MVRATLLSVLLVALISSTTTDAFQLRPARSAPESSKILAAGKDRSPTLMSDRRDAMGSMLGGFAVVAAALVTGGVETARALDMDAFMSSQVRTGCNPLPKLIAMPLLGLT
jgi:hypothetical protein